MRSLAPGNPVGSAHAFAPRFDPVSFGGKSLGLQDHLRPLLEIETRRLFASVPTGSATAGLPPPPTTAQCNPRQQQREVRRRRGPLRCRTGAFGGLAVHCRLVFVARLCARIARQIGHAGVGCGDCTGAGCAAINGAEVAHRSTELLQVALVARARTGSAACRSASAAAFGSGQWALDRGTDADSVDTHVAGRARFAVVAAPRANGMHAACSLAARVLGTRIVVVTVERRVDTAARARVTAVLGADAAAAIHGHMDTRAIDAGVARAQVVVLAVHLDVGAPSQGAGIVRARVGVVASAVCALVQAAPKGPAGVDGAGHAVVAGSGRVDAAVGLVARVNRAGIAVVGADDRGVEAAGAWVARIGSAGVAVIAVDGVVHAAKLAGSMAS
jgi:hypothetical protein